MSVEDWTPKQIADWMKRSGCFEAFCVTSEEYERASVDPAVSAAELYRAAVDIRKRFYPG